MNFDYKLLGNKLREARINQEYEINEVATYIKKTADEYMSIEKGEYILLDGDTVVLLAKLLKIDFRYLVTGNYPSAESQITNLFRQNSTISKNDRRAIQSFIRLCETKYEIENMLDLPKQNPVKYSDKDFRTNNHKKQGTIAAVYERERLQISDSISNVFSLLRKQKIHIFRRTLEDRNISGVYIKHPYAGHCILINYVDDINRQIFSTAHEYCHVLFDSDSEQRISYEKKNNDFVEIRANNFASNFLVPESVYNEFESKVSTSDSSLSKWIINVCKKYKVNKYVVIYRLSDKNLITDDTKIKLLSDNNLKVINSYKEDPEISNISPNLVAPIEKIIRSGISLEYINLCRNAYDQGLITYSKLVNSFFLDFENGKEIANMMDILLEV